MKEYIVTWDEIHTFETSVLADSSDAAIDLWNTGKWGGSKLIDVTVDKSTAAAHDPSCEHWGYDDECNHG